MNSSCFMLGLLGGWELLLILALLVGVAAAVALGVVFLVTALARKAEASAPPSSPTGTAQLAVCPRCGAALPMDAPQGLCPRCVLHVGIGTDDASEPAFKDASGKPNPPDPVELARHFPQLEIIELLGQGGMGAVYKARQKDLDRIVALKVLPGGTSGDPAFAERFSREARALARLNHPNIVAVHDFGQMERGTGFQPVSGAGTETENTDRRSVPLYYFIMEFIDGPNLRQLMQTRRLEPREAMSIVPRICEALQYAHDEGIVHRDIKPENILLDTKGRVKIADFGIAKILVKGRASGLTGAKDVIGTPHYMAPEQVERPAEVDHRADIYSLGVVFYEMLTGELPLGKFEVPSRKVQVDVRLDEVVLHSLEKEPARRYQHASEVRTDVQAISADAGKSECRMQNADAEQGQPTSAERTGRGRLAQQSKALLGARWTARVLGTVLLLFYATFIIAEGLPPVATQSVGVQLNFVALGLMLGGFAVGWKREGTAALLIAAGWSLWHISEGRINWNLFQTPLPVAALYAYCWWELRGRRTGLLLGSAAALAVALGVGRLFLPVNVLVTGGITDAATGEAITNADLMIERQTEVDRPKTDSPKARSGAEGRFRLHLGWYDAQQQLRITAPGYAALTTNLGPREPGQRRVNRHYEMVAASTAGAARDVPRVPPVVIHTTPESGTSDVDPTLAELRVTFSKAMKDGNWSWVDLGDGSFPEMTGDPRYLDDGRTCVLPVRLEPGRTYATWINVDAFQRFQDEDGTPAAPYLLVFETRK